MTCTIISIGEELNFRCKNENEPPYPEIKAKLREKIWGLYCNGYDRFWINCEYGVPLWCGEIITALAMYNDIKLSIAMPYEEQSTNWVEEHRERFLMFIESPIMSRSFLIVTLMTAINLQMSI